MTDDAVVADRRGVSVLVRNALFARVRLASQGRAEELGRLDQDAGFGESRWRRALDAYYEAHEAVLIDADARSMAYLSIDESDERADHVWRVRQVFSDPEETTISPSPPTWTWTPPKKKGRPCSKLRRGILSRNCRRTVRTKPRSVPFLRLWHLAKLSRAKQAAKPQVANCRPLATFAEARHSCNFWDRPPPLRRAGERNLIEKA